MPRWNHTDLELPARIGRGEARARSGDWESGSLNDRVADLRAYMAANLAAQADLVGTTTATAERVTIDATPSANVDPARLAAAKALAGTWGVLAGGNVYPNQELGTVAAGSGTADVGALPAAAVIVVALAATAAACYVAYQAADVVDRQLARLNKARELLQADETLKHLVDEHASAERAAGKLLPLSSATSAAMDLLRQRQAELAKETPKQNPADTVGSLVKWGLVAAVLVLTGRELLRARPA